MSKNELFCLGYSYTADALARRLRGQVSDQGWRIAGTTTSPDKADRMSRDGVTARLWGDDGFDPAWLDDATAILVSTPPGEDGCPALAAAGATIAERRKHIHWIGYLSTNGVYGDHDGAWVDEDSELLGSSPRAQRRIKAEADWRARAETHDLPLIIFRLPGIYGPGRSALDTVRAGKAKRIYKEGQVFSRMHVGDIAAALEASLKKQHAYGVYNLADDEPAPPQDVVDYACELLGVEPPPLTPIEDADLSPMAKSFYADNKRVSNTRMKEKLLETLAFPTYREGLCGIFKEENRRPA